MTARRFLFSLYHHQLLRMKLFRLLRFSNSSQRDDTFIANFKQQTFDPCGVAYYFKRIRYKCWNPPGSFDMQIKKSKLLQ